MWETGECSSTVGWHGARESQRGGRVEGGKGRLQVGLAMDIAGKKLVAG